MITSDCIARMLDEAAKAHPLECCGLLLGQGQMVLQPLPASNLSEHPENSFLIDPLVMLKVQREARNGGPQLLGYYHAHPNGREEPSQRDCAMAAADGMLWAIIAKGQIRCWRAMPEDSDTRLQNGTTRFVEQHWQSRR